MTRHYLIIAYSVRYLSDLHHAIDSKKRETIARKNRFKNSLRLVLVLFSLSLLLAIPSCSKTTEPGKAAVIQIDRFLDDLEVAVLQYEPEKIIEHLHPDFFHNGRDRYDQELIWHQRVLHFHTLKIEERDISVYKETAVTAFKMTFTGTDTISVTEEPSKQNGDISYLLKENGKWFMYGNQMF